MSMHEGRVRLPAAVVIAFSLLATACAGPLAGPSASLSPTPTSAATPVAPTPSGPATSPAGGIHEVNVRSSAAGDYLTGEDGRSLYLFANDTSSTSTCVDQCAQNWPPFTLDEGDSVVAGSGVTGTLGTSQRPDGSTQVTINGRPLYYFAADTAAGQTNGQGINGVWFLAAPDGTPLTGTSASPAASPGPTEGSPYHYR
jgi:predicted lipoprotein with Yx(FWY)xxD motif